MTVYDSSMLEFEATNTNSEQSQAAVERQEFDRIMDAAVNPALEMCSRMAELKKDGTAWEKEIFLANCTSYLQVCVTASLTLVHPKADLPWNFRHYQSTFHSFTFAESRVASMDRELDKHVNLLVQEHVRFSRSAHLNTMQLY